jgi:predicted dehydrogenase
MKLLQPVTAVLVGAGQRAMIYASYAKKHPERLRIVGVADPDTERRRLAAALYGIPESQCFDSVEALTAAPKLADAAINGTMDRLHVDTTLPLLDAGYHVLLEKPIGIHMDEIAVLREAAQRHHRIVMICHVLRYAPFYAGIRKTIASGEIGEIVNIQTAEHVSYHHMAVSFVRGKWNNEAACGSPMLLQKCCHDLDIIAWVMNGVKPVRVGSFGGLVHFRPEHAPEGAGKQCLLDCGIEATCPYSAKKHYIENDKWNFHVWDHFDLGVELTEEEKVRILKGESPYGRCVWHSDNDVVDRQSVMMEFENGATATHNMIGGAAKSYRTLHIVGTKGDIQGNLEDGYFVVRKPNTTHGLDYDERRIDCSVTNDSHGGGDLLLVEDFVQVLQGREPSLSYTALEESIYGHAIAFAAERARKENRLEAIHL